MKDLTQDILAEIQRRADGLCDRINDKNLDRFVRTELQNRFDVLCDLYYWIRAKVVEGNRETTGS